MRKLIVLLAFSGVAVAHCVAQSPVAEAPNMLPVCQESCTITAISNPAAVLQFGVGSTWNPTFSNPTLPLAVSDAGSVNPALGSTTDPANGTTKTLAAQQLPTTSYTVTCTGCNPTTVTIPAQVCTAIPTNWPTKQSSDTPPFTLINFQIPPTPPGCPLLANMAALQGGDGATITGWQQTTPIVIQRCVGPSGSLVCSAPLLLCACQPARLIGPSAYYGGPLVSDDTGGSGQLYVLQQIFPNTINFQLPGASAPTSTVISALPAPAPAPAPTS
jgi:hypothetical protein